MTGVRRKRFRIGRVSLSVEVEPPASTGRSGERVLEDGTRLFAPPPVHSRPRDRQRALDHQRPAELAGDGRQPRPEAQAGIAELRRKYDEAPDLQSKVDAVFWYHTIELPGGVVTPGNHDHRRIVDHIGLPEDMTGMRVLDVATFDGYWAFEFERRGASVVALDLPSLKELDWPAGVREIVEGENLDVPMGLGFAVAAEALGSKAEHRKGSVYELDPDEIGTFDLVHIGDLLLHLARPLDALRAVRKVTAGKLVLVDRYDPDISSTNGAQLIRYEGGWRGNEWWAPSLDALVQWVVDAGFERPQVRQAYQLAGVDKDYPGWHRAVIHAEG